jgi:hypothetical protein
MSNWLVLILQGKAAFTKRLHLSEGITALGKVWIGPLKVGRIGFTTGQNHGIICPLKTTNGLPQEEDRFMTKYLEQTSWLLNPEPDGRKHGRHAKQCWLPGTRWVLDGKILTGDGMRVGPGTLANTIIANCKEVEPGFGVIVDDWDYKEIIGRLIDQGKLSVKDIQDALEEDQQREEDEEALPFIGAGLGD